MDHGAFSSKLCKQAERWSTVKSVADVEALSLPELQIFAHHSMNCETHEKLLNSYENLKLSHLAQALPALGIKLSY